MSPRRYQDLAPWFHLLTAPAEYEEEAAEILELLRGAVEGPLETMLELGSGGGNNASHLKAHLTLTLVDLSPSMLEVSRGINPELEHLEGDMRSVRLGRAFDSVLVHDAITYMVSEDDLQQLATTVFEHLRPGGAAVLAPDVVAERFEGGTEHGGHDAEDGRGLRYLMWEWDPDPTDTRATAAFAYIVRSADGTTEVAEDRNEFGLFPTETWLRILRDAAFEVSAVDDKWGRVIFVCRRVAA